MKKAILTIFIFLFCVSAANAGGFLKVTGKYITNDNGEIQLRGVGLGGWLLPEGYMLQTSSFADEFWKMKNKFSALAGQAGADSFWTTYRKNFVTRKDMEYIASLGFNSVRLVLHYGDFMTRNDTGFSWKDEGFAIVDSVVQWGGDNNIYTILDLHAAPGGESAGGIADYNPAYPSLWQSDTNKTMTIELWRKLAARYKDRPWVGGYDILNEPAWDLGSGNTPLRDLYIAITNAIRESDSSHIIFVEGNWYATDFSGLTPPWDANMVYSFHKYWNSTDVGTINYLLSIRNTYNRPLWLGESGENSNQWFADCIGLMESYNIGWSWWTYKKIGTINGILNVKKTSEYNTLLNYWNGSGSAPSQAYATAALLGQADKFSLDQCEPRKDVIYAMMTLSSNPKQTMPYADNTVPGKILGINYDMGENGVTYSDADYQSTSQGSSWNTGWSYRNDGVDIEPCNDLFSGGYDVGWISNSEFLRFTFTATEAGTYNVSARVAAQNAGGRILTQVDDSILVGLGSVPATGGYQSWKTISIGSCTLSPGTHKLRLYFTVGGFNLTYVDFSLAPTGVNENNSQPNKFGLEQNYPNPFNPSTTIRYQIPKDEFVTLKIFDSLGREIATLVNGKKEAGNYEATFDASKVSNGYASGVYFYTMTAGNYTATKKLLLTK